MIKRLKRRFILLASISILALMTMLVGTINIINFSSVEKEADKTIDFLAELTDSLIVLSPQTGFPDREARLPSGMSPEVQYESRFFYVVLDTDGEVIYSNTSQIISVSEDEAKDYAQKVYKSNSSRGFKDSFRYLKQTYTNGTKIVFLDCGRRLDTFYRFLAISVCIGLLGCGIVFLFFLLFAERIIRPISESYEKQKRFITDAGHEIKTPLTIISANTDLLECDLGENESLSDIRQQTTRLRELTNELVFLSKMEESENELQRVEFPISDLITETAQSFLAPIEAQSKTISLKIPPKLSYVGAPDSIRRLISILIDNAVKYSPPSGRISVSLTADNKMLTLTVSNTSSERLTQENISHLFERFYRSDSSRNSETGGHGIGLSIAEAVTEAHGGKISASYSEDNIFTITVKLPIQK